MAKFERNLTNLEAAILAEVEHLGPQTAFQVRSSFAASLSVEWKGSAGAVYPAVARLSQEGLILASEPAGGRKARMLSITGLGRTVLKKWATDASAASSVGVDPFRMRASLWAKLPRSEQRSLLVALERELRQSVAEFEECLASVDSVEAVRVSLSLHVQLTRLAQVRLWKQKGIVQSGIIVN